MVSPGDLLTLLRAGGPEFVSGEELSGRLGVTRAAVWKHMRQLAAEGYDIEAAPHKGYRLRSVPDRLLPDEIRADLRTRRFGREIQAYQETSSTNDRALDWAAAGAPEGALVAAEAQSRGRGRRDRIWWSPSGVNLLFSMVFRPPWTAEQAPLLTLLAAAAVAAAVRRVTDLPARIKWPNDVLVNGGKVAGILTEMRAQADAIAFAVCGVGLNVNAAPAGSQNYPATSLSAEVGRPVPRLPLLRAILEETEALVDRTWPNGPEPVVDAYRRLTMLQGALVTVSLAGDEQVEGVVQDVDERGALLVRLETGLIRRLATGEILRLRPCDGASKIPRGKGVVSKPC